MSIKIFLGALVLAGALVAPFAAQAQSGPRITVTNADQLKKALQTAGAQITVPRGVFDVGQVKLASGVTIGGVGSAKTTIKGELTADGASDVTISLLRLDGDNMRYKTGMDFSNMKRFRMEGVVIRDFADRGFTLGVTDGVVNAVDVANSTRRVLRASLNFPGGSITGSAVGFRSSKNLRVDNLKVSTIGRSGRGVTGQRNVDDPSPQNAEALIFENVTFNGIDVRVPPDDWHPRWDKDASEWTPLLAFEFWNYETRGNGIVFSNSYFNHPVSIPTLRPARVTLKSNTFEVTGVGGYAIEIGPEFTSSNNTFKGNAYAFLMGFGGYDVNRFTSTSDNFASSDVKSTKIFSAGTDSVRPVFSGTNLGGVYAGKDIKTLIEFTEK